jgi:putative hydrolase of the HAD superfamily
MSAVLLDAMGTIVTFVAPAPRLRALLASRYGVDVSEETARAAMAAEIAHYRREHDRAVDAAALAAVRRECADVLRAALGRDQPAALALDLDGPGGLTATLVEAIAFEPFPETVAVLTELRARGHRLAVVSNWDVSLLEVLERTGLAPFFAAVAISAVVGASKPDPRPFTAALDALGVGAADAIHVGDTYGEDVVGARAVGVRPVLVDRSGAVPRDDVTVVADLRGLLALP